ncbi:MAG: hypothetical protein FWC19_03535 [Treponema sp.]|nr:hypothetical protein [Treponema sp.]MCL2271862.1 hypothetical protein [Treponema sp.]
MNSKLKTALRVYKIFSVCLISILIIAALIIWINIGKITVFALKKTLDNYNTEITEMISDYLASSGESLGVKSIQVVNEEGVQALRFDFSFDARDLARVDINSYRNKSSKQIVSELGITPEDIPPQIKSLVQSTKLAVDIYILNDDDNIVFNRRIMPNEIAEFLN